jgi:hypothetical protein
MQIVIREVRIAFRHFWYALIATAILIVLFSAFVSSRANKPIDCSWRNQSERIASQVNSVDWHCADAHHITTRW